MINPPPQNSFANGATSKEIENGSKMSKNMGLRNGVIFSGGRRSGWVAGISEGGYVGPTGHLGAPRGWARPLACGSQVHPPGVCSVPKILKYCIKIILNFQDIWRTFILGSIFYCTDNSENSKIIAFLLY